MNRIFVYPVGNPSKSIAKNPYIKDMLYSIYQNYKLVNKLNQYTKFGVFDAIFNFRKTDTYIFNWVENIPDRKLGFFQALAFIIFSILLKHSKKKFIWVLHNKSSHNGKFFLSKLCMDFAAFYSNKIITHASDGILFIDKEYGRKISKKVKYVPHPTNIYEYKKIQRNLYPVKPIYDFIIWGAISKYKGLEEFIHFISNSKEWKNKKILICGKPTSSEYYESLIKNKLNNITIIGEYIDDNRLIKLISYSKIILFVYNNRSVLSSGALVKSLYYKKLIIGPNVGSFKDLKKIGIVYTFDNFDQILPLSLKPLTLKIKEVNDYIYNNEWNININKIIF